MSSKIQHQKLDILEWTRTGFWTKSKDSDLLDQENESQVLSETTHNEWAITQDIMEDSEEGDILDPSDEDENYKTIIMPALVDVDSDCETDILDKIASAADNENDIYLNTEKSKNEASNHNSPAKFTGDARDADKITNGYNSSNCENSPGFENSRIAFKNENFDSSITSSDISPTKMETTSKKNKFNYDSSDSVDTMVYIKSNQKVRGVKTGYKKRLKIPYKVYNTDIVEKKADEIGINFDDKKFCNTIDKQSSIDRDANCSVDDDNMSTTVSTVYEDESYASIVMPEPEAMDNSESETSINDNVCSENSVDLLDRSYDESHLVSVVMPATENVDSDCETDILEVDFSADENLSTVSDSGNYTCSNSSGMVVFNNNPDLTFNKLLQVANRNKEVEHNTEDDDNEDIGTFHTIAYDPSKLYKNCATQLCAFKTMEEFFKLN